jgi:DNA-binding protein HU-beta
MATINKAKLAEIIAERLGLSKKESEAVLNTIVDVITKTLVNGGEVNLAGFGAFSARTRKGRAGVNPQNPSEKIDIPSVTVPKFKAGKGLKDSLKAPHKNSTSTTPAPSAPPVSSHNEDSDNTAHPHAM